MTIPKKEWVWFGNAGHFCMSHECRFHLTTQVGNTLVSTVGELYVDGLRQKIGGKDYESMLFVVTGTCSCGCGLPEHDGQELACLRYDTPDEATKGHMDLCQEVAEGLL